MENDQTNDAVRIAITLTYGDYSGCVAVDLTPYVANDVMAKTVALAVAQEIDQWRAGNAMEWAGALSSGTDWQHKEPPAGHEVAA